MMITDLKINGIKTPIGFDFDKVIVSWKVSETLSKTSINTCIEVSMEESFQDIIYQIEDKDLLSNGTTLSIALLPYTRYYYRIKVLGDCGDWAISDIAYFETAKMGEIWEGKWIGLPKDIKYHPILFKHFQCDKEIERARLYICGVGMYEAYLNGDKVGEEFFAPFLNDYQSGLQYETYDITEQINRDNKIDILLGNGWYKGNLGYHGKKEIYGNRFAAIAEIHILYTDGTSKKIVTDTDWSFKGSDIEESDIYDGEVINRCKWDNRPNPILHVEIIEIEQPLVERYSIPVVIKEELNIKEIIRTQDGEIILDMGQNFTGFMEFDNIDIPTGKTITLEYGEVLQNGEFYRDNYRNAKAKFVYTSAGIKERVGAHFTFCGFRYVKVSGFNSSIEKMNFVGKVIYSDLDRTGYIETSNKKINQLFSNSFWGQKSNFLDIPTDCPQRNERLGWTGDAQVFAPTATYHMDTKAFYHKFLKDLRLDQKRHNGMIASYIPSLEDNYGASVWGDAATFIPDTLYEFYGDISILEEHYPLMKDWVDSITRRDKARGGQQFLFNFGFHFGDWLAMDGVSEQSFKGSTEDEYIASAYYYASTVKVAKAASLIKKTEEAKFYTKLAENIKSAFIEEYFTASGRLAMDTQTGYYVALKFKLYKDVNKVLEALRIRLKKDCYKIKGGFVGATMMCCVLAEYDMSDMAYHFLFNEKFPGWLYCVNLGATTIWERWNSINPDGTISGTGMNSLNHYSYGAVMEFMYRYAAGIQPLEAGFQKIQLAPTPTNNKPFEILKLHLRCYCWQNCI